MPLFLGVGVADAIAAEMLAIALRFAEFACPLRLVICSRAAHVQVD
jgi:hypothetical protein